MIVIGSTLGRRANRDVFTWGAELGTDALAAVVGVAVGADAGDAVVAVRFCPIDGAEAGAAALVIF